MWTMISWGIFVILMAIVQWYIIDVKIKFPDKTAWFNFRIFSGFIFLFIFNAQGYILYWTAPFLVFSFWLPFNIIINQLRGEPVFDLSPENSVLDEFVLKIFRLNVVVYGFGLIAFITVISMMVLYGQCTWSEVNYRHCGG